LSAPVSALVWCPGREFRRKQDSRIVDIFPAGTLAGLKAGLLDIDDIGSDLDFVHRVQQRARQQYQAGAKRDHPWQNGTQEKQEHGNRTQEETEYAERLHAFGQHNPLEQHADLSGNQGVVFLGVHLRELADQLRQHQKPVGEGQQQQ